MRIFNKLVVLVSFFVLSSCSSMIKIQVSGMPGTIIKNADGVTQGIIDNEGDLTIKVPRGKYDAFMLSKSPESDIYVPFALEYEHRAGVSSVGGIFAMTLGAPILPLSMSFLWALQQHDLTNGYRYIPVQTNEDLNIR